eukprot:gene5333-3832_t
MCMGKNLMNAERISVKFHSPLHDDEIMRHFFDASTRSSSSILTQESDDNAPQWEATRASGRDSDWAIARRRLFAPLTVGRESALERRVVCLSCPERIGSFLLHLNLVKCFGVTGFCFLKALWLVGKLCFILIDVGRKVELRPFICLRLRGRPAQTEELKRLNIFRKVMVCAYCLSVWDIFLGENQNDDNVSGIGSHGSSEKEPFLIFFFT